MHTSVFPLRCTQNYILKQQVWNNYFSENFLSVQYSSHLTFFTVFENPNSQGTVANNQHVTFQMKSFLEFAFIIYMNFGSVSFIMAINYRTMNTFSFFHKEWISEQTGDLVWFFTKACPMLTLVNNWQRTDLLGT